MMYFCFRLQHFKLSTCYTYKNNERIELIVTADSERVHITYLFTKYSKDENNNLNNSVFLKH